MHGQNHLAAIAKMQLFYTGSHKSERTVGMIFQMVIKLLKYLM